MKPCSQRILGFLAKSLLTDSSHCSIILIQMFSAQRQTMNRINHVYVREAMGRHSCLLHVMQTVYKKREIQRERLVASVAVF